jgi:hypothetical protein
MTPQEERMLAELFAARWLGHGRAIECYLACVTVIYGVALLMPGAAFDSRVTYDLAWLGYGQVLAIPLLLHAVLAGTGLAGNIAGWRSSRMLRFFGGMLGCAIWTWYTIKFALGDQFAAVGFPFCAMAALFSVRVMGMALANLPRPGVPGVSGQ